MAKGATPKKKREDENRQNSQHREETRQRQTQREPDRSQANSRQTTRRDVAPTAIPVLEERTPRRSANGRNVAALFPEYEAPQTTNIPKVEPILTENRNQGFAPDIDSRVQRRNAQGIRLDAEDRIKASDASQYGAEQAEEPQMEEYPSTAERGRKDAQRATTSTGQNRDYQGGGGGRSFEKESNLSDIAQQTVDDINKKIDRLSVIPTGTLGAVDQKMSELYNEADTIRTLDNLSVNEKMDYLLNPEHRMSKSEQDYAESIFDEYLENNPKAKELYSTNDAAMSSLLAQRMTPEEADEYAKMVTLKNKTSDLSSAGLHMAESMPFVKSLADKSAEAYDNMKGTNTAEYDYSNQLEQTQTQNPLASIGGNMAYQLGQYAAFAPLIEEIPAVGKLASGIGSKFNNPAVAKAVENIIAGQAADTFLDTLPNEIIPDLMEGNWRNLPKDIVLNQLGNLAFNVAGEGIGALARNLIPSLRQTDEAADAVKQNELNPVDLARQNEVDANALNAERQQIAENIENLKNQIPDVPEEVNPDDVIYHAGIVSRLNKAETAGKMGEGSRNTGYYGTGHYFVDAAHRNEIGPGTGYGSKPYTSVDISKYKNLFKADTDAKASKLHELSERMMRYINGHNDYKYIENGEINADSLKEYMDDMYSNYKDLFQDKAMSREVFDDWVNNYKNNFHYDFYDRGDSPFTTFMKEHGYNGVDTRGTRSADTARGVVIYDLDEDSILQSNVTDEAVKNGLMNTRVRNENPIFDSETDARIQKDIDAFNKRESIRQEYNRIYDTTKLDNLKSQIEQTKERIDTIENDAIGHYRMILEDEKYLNREVNESYRLYEEVGLDDEITKEEIAEQLRAQAKEGLEESKVKLDDLQKQLDEIQSAYDAEEKISVDAYNQAKRNVDNANELTIPNKTEVSGGTPNGGDIVPPKAEVGPAEPSGKVSQFATNSMQYGTNLTPEEYAANVDLNEFRYQDKTERQSMTDAFNMIREEGVDSLKARLLADDAKDLSQSEIDALMALTRTNNATARALEAEGKDASAIRAETTAIYKKLRQESTSNAQGLQALAKWTRNTPEGMLMHAENIVSGNTKTEKSVLQEALEKLRRRHKDIEFSPDFERRFLEEAEKLQDIGDMDSREAKDIMARLGRMINDEIPVRLNEKVQAYLMDNMLGNFRTLITRNAGGNIGLNAMEQTMTRPLAAGIDRLVSLKTGKRTQAGMTREALSEYVQGFAKGLSDEAHDLSTGLHTARSGQNTLEEAVRANRHVFKNKVMDKLDSLVKNGLSVGDRPFYEATYKQTLGDYYRLRNQMGPEVAELSDEAFDEYAKTAAELNALAAVYQNDSLLSNGLMKIKNGIGDFSEGAFGFDILSQFSMPFVKTPANVVDRAIDYSPLGIVRNTIRTAKEGGIGGENFDQNRFVNETARNAIGTVGTGLGVGAAKAGILSGGYSDDTDVKQAQKDSGMQEYALNLPNDYQMDIGWIPVVGSNAVASAAAYDAYQNSDESLIPALMEGLSAGGKSMFDQSMFQGMQRLFGTGESYDRDSNIVKNVGSVVTQGFGQAIPSLVRQLAQVTDPYKRDTGNSNKDWSFGPFNNYTINGWINNIPGLREALLAPSVDRQGELVKENQGRNIASKVLEDMILPGKISHVEANPLDAEAERLATATGNDVSYMPRANRKDVDTEDHTLTNDEWVQYQQDYYGNATEVGNAIINSDFYQDMSPADQENMLSGAYEAIHTAEKSKYKPSDLNGAPAAYEAGGQEGLINYLFGDKAYKGAGINGSSNAAKAVKGLASEGRLDEAQTLADNLSVLSQNGVTSKGQGVYADRGSSVFPDMSADEYAKYWNALNTDNKNGITQDDLINAFNNSTEIKDWVDSLVDSGMTKDEALHTVWSGFLETYTEGKTKEPYVMDDGMIGVRKVTSEETSEEKPSETPTETNSSSSEDWLTQVTSNRKPNEVTTLEPQYQPGAPISTEAALERIANTGIQTTAASSYWPQAYAVDPTLTPEQFAQDWASIDLDHNGMPKKDEWVTALNNNNLDEAGDRRLIQMYYNTGWNPLRYNNGQWSK